VTCGCARAQATQVIADTFAAKIVDGDVVMTYSYGDCVEAALLAAFKRSVTAVACFIVLSNA
jgi:translation initiation factor 2B subunit (eIF-2B alpha/beta/delta family)